MRRILAAALACPLLLTAAAGPLAAATTTTSTMSVKVNVVEPCRVSGGTLDFGTYVAGQATDLLAQANISYTSCPAGTLTFELDNGLYVSSGQRRMNNGSTSNMRYNLYRNSARTTVFGTGTNAQTVTQAALGSGTVVVYGTIPAGITVPAGTYTDTVAVTLSF